MLHKGETGLAGEGHLDDPEDDVEKSMGASCKINFSDNSSLSPSRRLEKECDFPRIENLTAKGNDQWYLMSFCDRTVTRGLRNLLL